MPLYAASISKMITMPVGVLTADYIDVWCNTATDTPHKIRVGDMIAVKWNADTHDREYTWCTVLATTHVAFMFIKCSNDIIHVRFKHVPVINFRDDNLIETLLKHL